MAILSKDPSSFRKLEFWWFTAIFLLLFFSLVDKSIEDQAAFFEDHSNGRGGTFTFYENYFFPQLFRYLGVYLFFFVMNFSLIPRLLKKKDFMRNVILAVLVSFLLFLIILVTEVFLSNHSIDTERGELVLQNNLKKSLVFTGWILLFFTLYSGIKLNLRPRISNRSSTVSFAGLITPGGIGVIIISFIFVLLLIAGDYSRNVIIGWSVMILSGIILFWYSLHSLIPRSVIKVNPFKFYFLQVLGLLVIFFLPLGLFLTILTDWDAGMQIAIFFVGFHVFVTVPSSWFFFRHRMKGREELYQLKKELGTSTATLHFLRSQINPHFLFNALNTVYGVAISEGADRTSEAVHNLSRMMRFMLHENIQEKIPLSREIEYINNYIDLQRLRTDFIPLVEIEVKIQDDFGSVDISPMLLIPFIDKLLQPFAGANRITTY